MKSQLLTRTVLSVCLLALPGCTTPEMATRKIMIPQYQALSQQYEAKQISQKCYNERRQELDAQGNAYYTMLLQRQLRARQMIMGMVAGMNAARMQQPLFAGNNPSFASPFDAGFNRYNPNSLANPYGAGSPYKADGIMNPYSQYGSPHSDKSWRNPYATDAPKLYNSGGQYLGRFSSNQYDPDSTSNPYGRYGSPYSPDSINNPYGAGNPYSASPVFVVPQQ
ncbi:MAG: hypothetical protein WCO97_08300 [bacterium]